MPFDAVPEKLEKAAKGAQKPGHLYTSRHIGANGEWEYEYPPGHEPPEKKSPEWRIHKIEDLRPIDWDTGKRVALAAGEGAECQRCGKEHAIVYHMEHKETGNAHCVGSGCGAGMAGGTHNIDDASVKQAQREAKDKVLGQAREKINHWVKTISDELLAKKFPKPEIWLRTDAHRKYGEGNAPTQDIEHKQAVFGFKDLGVFVRMEGAHPEERAYRSPYGDHALQMLVGEWLDKELKQQLADKKVPEDWPFPKDLKDPQATVKRQVREKIWEDLKKNFQTQHGYTRNYRLPEELKEYTKPYEPWAKSFGADDLYVVADDFDLCMSLASDLTEQGEYDRAMDLVKGATHKYLRRYPSGKASPRWYYVYKVTSRHQGAPVQEGEKIKLTHEGQAGHYEVKRVHANGYVTMQHDETKHQVSVKQEHLHEMFSQEHKGAIDTAHARLRQTFEAAQKYGNQGQRDRARAALRDHEDRYQIHTPERVAKQQAMALTVLTHTEPTVENHQAAADSHRRAAAMGVDHAEMHQQLADQHEVAAKTRMALKASAAALKDPEPRFHVPANEDTVVDAPVIVLPPKSKRGGKRDPKGAYFGTKQHAYKAIKNATESNGNFLDNFHAADAAYWSYLAEHEQAKQEYKEAKRLAKEKGEPAPKMRKVSAPPPYEGGDLDALNSALSLEKPKRVLGKEPKDPRVSSPAEAWDRLVAGAKRWDSSTTRHAVQVFQDWFKDNSVPMHLPSEAHSAIIDHYQAKADANYAEGMGGEHEAAEIHELEQKMSNADPSFDPDEIEAGLDDSFDFGFNAEPQQAMAKAVSGLHDAATGREVTYLPLNWAQNIIADTPGYGGGGTGKGTDPYIAAALKRAMTPKGIHAVKFLQECRSPSGPALDPRGEPLEGKAPQAAVGAFLARLPKKYEVGIHMAKSLDCQPHLFVLPAESLQKGGPYIGPKGGMWADAKHTQHWDPTQHTPDLVPREEMPQKTEELAGLSHDDLGKLKAQQDAYLAKLNAEGAMVPISVMRLGRIIDAAIEKKGPRLVATLPAKETTPETPPFDYDAHEAKMEAGKKEAEESYAKHKAEQDTRGKVIAQKVIEHLKAGGSFQVNTPLRSQTYKYEANAKLTPSGQLKLQEGKGRWISLTPGQLESVAAQIEATAKPEAKPETPKMVAKVGDEPQLGFAFDSAVPTPVPPMPAPPQVKPVPATKAVDPIAETAKAVDEGNEGPRKIMPIGDHIWGSKKDLKRARIESAKDLEGMTYSDAVKIVQKRHLVPAFDLMTLKALGQSPGTAHLTLAVLASIVQKPGKTPEARAQYVDEVKSVLGSLQACKKVTDVWELLEELARSHRKGETRKLIPGMKVFEDKAEAFDTQKRMQKEDPHRKFIVVYADSNAREVMSYHRAYTIKEEVNAPYESLGNRFVRFIHRQGDDASAAYMEALTVDNLLTRKDSASGKEPPFIADGWAHLEARNLEKAVTAKAVTEAKAKKTNVRGFSRAQVYMMGKGKAIRKGGVPMQTADERRTKATFHLREIDYGTEGYMGQADREFHTAQVEAAFHDLADVLEIPTKDISFSGRLGVALGARGDWDSPFAHYEPDKFVINITKFKGGSALAHEWGHGLDNLISFVYRPEKNTSTHLSDVPDASFLPEHIRHAFGELHKAMSLHPDPEKAKANHEAHYKKLAAKDAELTETYNKFRGQYDALQKKVKPEIVAGSIEREKKNIERYKPLLAEAEKKLAVREATRLKMKDRGPRYLPPGYEKAMQDVSTYKYWLQNSQARLKGLEDGSLVRTEADGEKLNELAYQVGSSRGYVNEIRDQINAHAKIDPLMSDWKRGSTLLGDYWSTPTEMFARAMECYVADELEKRGRQNTYLVSGKRTNHIYETDKMLPDGSFAQPFPQGEERKRIMDAMGTFLRQLRESGDLKKSMDRLLPLQRFTIRGDMQA